MTKKKITKKPMTKKELMKIIERTENPHLKMKLLKLLHSM
jgi:hypothetical protein